MRVLQLVAGEKWTGVAAVVVEQTQALVESGVEAQIGIPADSPLAARLLPEGWVRPLLSPAAAPLRFLRDVASVRAAISREPFDLLHAHLSHDHYVAAAATRGTGIGLARTLHHVRHAAGDPLVRRLFHATDAFAFANAEVGRRANLSGPILPPVVDVDRFRPGPRREEILNGLGVPSGAFVVGTVGKISRGRGHDLAIEALRAAPPRACLLHVGKGEHRGQLERHAARLGLSRRNVWAGYQEESLPDLYRAMDAFLFTASGSDQGQRAILEAMASGVPVVACDLPGVRDLVTDGREGLIASGAAGLADAIARLEGSPDFASSVGARGRERALEFDGPRFTGRAVRFYAAVVGAVRGR